ncbi:MAG: ribonuclease P protein component [Sandaracinaceae bacterium]|nr:ribonuclease P protein component [Sandaracinaceae bacterium]
MELRPARLTLRPADRLKRREDFRRVQETGRKHHSPHFLVVVLVRDDQGPARIGITVTKKVGNAVQRNRVKRLVREVFRRERARFPEGCDVVFIAKNGAPALGYAEVLAEVPTRWSIRRGPERGPMRPERP